MKKIIFIFCILISEAKAKEVSAPPLGVLVGVGEIIKTNLRFDNDYGNSRSTYLFKTIPFVTLHYGPLMIGANGITFSFLGDRQKSIYFNFNQAGDRYYATGMARRKESWMAGFGARYHDYNLLIAKDMGHRSHGTRVNLGYSRMFVVEELSYLRTSLNLDFFNARFSNYYYGVRTDEVTNNRAYYNPSGYLQLSASIFGIRKLHEKINGTIGVTVAKIPSKVIDSPTTKNLSYDTTIITGLTWTVY